MKQSNQASISRPWIHRILTIVYLINWVWCQAQTLSLEELDAAYYLVWDSFETESSRVSKKPELDEISVSDLQSLPGIWQFTYFPGIQGFEARHVIVFSPNTWRAFAMGDGPEENGYWHQADPHRLVLYRKNHELRAFLMRVKGQWQLLDAESEEALKPLSKKSQVASQDNPNLVARKPSTKLQQTLELSTTWPRSIGDGPEVAPDPRCVVSEYEGNFVLSGNGRVQTVQGFTPPFKLKVVAKTDVTNIRLYYDRGQIILNWELNPRELRLRDPRTGKKYAFPGKGFVVVNDWHDIEWEVASKEMRLIIDGEIRTIVQGNYKGMKGRVGIGAAHGSRVTVSSFQVIQGFEEFLEE